MWLPALLEIFSHAVIDHLVLEWDNWHDRLTFIGSRPSDNYFRSVCWFVCLFVQFFSAVFDPISIKLGHVMSGSSCVP